MNTGWTVVPSGLSQRGSREGPQTCVRACVRTSGGWGVGDGHLNTPKTGSGVRSAREGCIRGCRFLWDKLSGRGCLEAREGSGGDWSLPPLLGHV